MLTKMTPDQKRWPQAPNTAKLPARVGQSVQQPGRYASNVVAFADRASDGDTIVINGRTYEFDSNATYSGMPIDISGSSDVDGDITAAAAAINADTMSKVAAIADTDNDNLLLFAIVDGADANAFTLAETGTNLSVRAATFAGGLDACEVNVQVIRHTVTTFDATAGVIYVKTGFTELLGLFFGLEDAGVVAEAGVEPDFDSDTGLLTIAEGTPAWAADDVLNIKAIGKLA